MRAATIVAQPSFFAPLQHHAAKIAAAAKEQLGFDIDKKKMKLDDAIKALGTYEVPVKLHREVTAKLVVKVEQE